MSGDETELRMVERHVREGRAHVERQRAIVARLRAGGQPWEVAEQLLAEFETIQGQHEAHLERLQGRGQDRPAPISGPS